MQMHPVAGFHFNNDQPICLELPSLDATQTLGEILGRSLPPGSILLLQGNLGSGKTTLVNAIGTGLGIHVPIISPTFVLVNEYDDGRIPLYHFDLYRLNSNEVAELTLEQYWDEQEYEPGIVAIEWADRLGDRPPYALTIQLSSPADENANHRRATLTLEGDWIPDIQDCWEHLKQLGNSKDFPKG